MKIVKITFEDTDGGKYKFYTTKDNLLPILEQELFTGLIIDAKTGERIIHREKIMAALNIEPK
jgi:hypothetical protein